MSRRLNTSELLPPSANQTDDLLCDLAIISVLDLRGRARETRKGEGGENTGCQHVSVLDWECRWSRGIRRFLSLAFTECALNELINIH